MRRGGGADFYHIDFVLKPDRSGRPKAPPSGDGAAPGTVFYQEVPAPAKAAFEQGSKSLKNNDLAGAEVALVRAVQLFPDYYDALELLGSEYVRYAQYDAAVPLLTHATEINQRSWEAYYGLGVALIELGQRSEGLTAVRHAIELNPNYINANMRLGLELAKEEATREEAIKSLTRVTQLAGKRLPDAYLKLASLYSAQKQYGEAASALEQFLKAVPNSPQRESIKLKISELRQKANAQ
jgi:tetratricopeptide (TPR) repeat protein